MKQAQGQKEAAAFRFRHCQRGPLLFAAPCGRATAVALLLPTAADAAAALSPL